MLLTKFLIILYLGENVKKLVFLVLIKKNNKKKVLIKC